MTTIGQKIIAAAARRRPRVGTKTEAFPPRRILVMRLNRLGDLICTLPLYRTLQLNWPEARIDWLLSNYNAVLAPFLRASGNVYVHERGRVRYWLPEKLLRDLQSQEYDLSVAVKGGYDSLLAWISLAVNARQRVGFVGKARHRFDFAYNIPLPLPRPQQHQVEKCLELMKDFYLPKRSDDIHLELPAAARERVRGMLRRWGLADGKPFAVFQLSSTKRPYCQWPLEHFVELGKRLVKQGVPVFANALPEERDLIEKLRASLGPSTRPALFSDMGEYLGFLGASKVVVGSDGGGIHLAAAMGTRTIAFYAESSPTKWKPWQGEHIQFYTANRDVREVTPEMVWEKLTAAGWLR